MTADPELLSFERLGPNEGTRMLVVGGCGGIGRRLAEVSVELSLDVIVLDTALALDQHPTPEGVTAFEIDVRDTDTVSRAFANIADRWDAIDCLVHLPGYALPPTAIDEITPEQWDDLVAVTLTSLHRVAREALPLMRKSQNASFITMASGLAVLVEKGVSAYAASKAGIIAITKSIAKENAPHIRANAVAPGAVDTEFLSGGTGREITEARNSSFEKGIAGGKLLDTIPFGRIAVPDDVVGPILFLAGPASRYMTGQVLFVNGGRLMP